MDTNAKDNVTILNFSSAVTEFNNTLQKIDLKNAVLLIDTLLDVCLGMAGGVEISTVRVSNRITTTADWCMVTSYKSGKIIYALPGTKKPTPYYFQIKS